MNTKQKEKLNKILSDKTSGSQEILLKLNRFLLSIKNDRKSFINSLSIARNNLSHFAVIDNYLNKIEKIIGKNYKDMESYLLNIETSEEIKYRKIFEKIYKKLPNADSILTFSKSDTLINIFKLWHKKNKNLKLVINESRPSYEGKLMAKELLKYGMKVTMITDAMSGIFVQRSDAVIIGADAILKNGNIVNKTGSLALALLCKHLKKPFYVVATKAKNVQKNRLKINEDYADVVWKYKHPGLKTTNILFEEIEKSLITGIISE